MLRLPASPPELPSGWNAAACEPSFWNLNDGVTRFTTAATCGDVSFDMPAGFDHTVVASCASAAPPANALPSPDADVSFNWKPAPHACPPARPRAMLPTIVAIWLRFRNRSCMTDALLVRLDI